MSFRSRAAMIQAASFLLLSILGGFVLGHHAELELGDEFADLSEILHSVDVPDPDPFQSIYPNWTPLAVDVRDSGPRLILNDMDPKQVKNVSRITGPLGDVESYSGYICVDPKYNSSLFFWYIPSEAGVDRSPLVIWLQGGPGASSLFGLFTEIGPYDVVKGELQRREYSWHQNVSLLFIDSPIGTGFSFTESSEGYRVNQRQVSQDLYNGLQGFLNAFPELRNRPLFLTGESYAGKHIPSFASEIHKMKHSDQPKINLRGIAIGNPFIDPPENIAYSKIGSVLGLVDTPTRKTMLRVEAAIPAMMKKNKTRQAHTLLSTDLYLLMRNANLTNIYNLLRPHDNALDAEFIEYLQSPESRASLHVGDTEFSNIGEVYHRLSSDFMNSGMDDLRTIVGEYPILLYSGHMDLIVAYPFTRYVVESLSGPCPHTAWLVGGRLAGYKHRCGEIELALVYKAGHMVPTDQPEAAFDLIADFIKRSLHES